MSVGGETGWQIPKTPAGKAARYQLHELAQQLRLPLYLAWAIVTACLSTRGKTPFTRQMTNTELPR